MTVTSDTRQTCRADPHPRKSTPLITPGLWVFPVFCSLSQWTQHICANLLMVSLKPKQTDEVTKWHCVLCMEEANASIFMQAAFWGLNCLMRGIVEASAFVRPTRCLAHPGGLGAATH